MTKIAVIIPAAGSGSRMGLPIAKQFIEVAGKTILAYTIEKIASWAEEYKHEIVIMVALSDNATLPQEITNVETCIGGKNRADSVANALDALSIMPEITWAMVHDAARPLVNISDIEKLYQSLKNDKVGGILAHPITETVKRTHPNQRIHETISRENLWLAQTPQLFRYELLKQSLSGNRAHLTDEASGIEAMGLQPKLIIGDRENIKITTPSDLIYFEKQVNYTSK